MHDKEVRKLTELEDTHWWYAERRHLLARSIAGMTPGRALDIGAAGGGNSRVLAREGWDVLALEYGAEGAQVGKERGLDVIRADATQLPLDRECVDLVVAYDVLEHIPDHDAAVREVHRILRPDGTFLIAVPCDPRLWSAHDVAVDHVRRYTRGTLSELLLRNRFRIEELWSWNVLLRPTVALRRRTSTGSDLEQLPRPVNLALKGVVTVERYLPVKGLPGVTLMVTARPA